MWGPRLGVTLMLAHPGLLLLCSLIGNPGEALLGQESLTSGFPGAGE